MKMDKTKRKRLIFTIMLMLAIGNYSRLKGTEHVRAIEFVSIFSIGAIAGLLFYSIVGNRNNGQEPENKG